MSSRQRPFNVYRDFTSFSSDIDLTSQAGIVASPATRIHAANTTAGDLIVVIKGADGVDCTLTVPAEDDVLLDDVEVYSIDSTTTASRVTAFWLDEGQRRNPSS